MEAVTKATERQTKVGRVVSDRMEKTIKGGIPA